MPDPVRREQLLAKAVQEGKIPPTRVDHYRGLYEVNPIETEQILAGLTSGLLPGEFESVQVALTGGASRSSAPAGADPFRFDPAAGTGRIFNAKD